MSRLLGELKKYFSLKRKKANEWFFKTGKGEYGEGDKFVGVAVPDIRKVSRKFYGRFCLDEIEEALNSPIHEERLGGLFILVEMYKKGSNQKEIFGKNFTLLKRVEIPSKSEIFKFYIKNAKKINNWDLVDSSAPYIVGGYLLKNKKDRKVLYKLARSTDLWERRISIISTMAFIQEEDIEDALKISKILLQDSHDLIHKAVGWMLRESWKKDSKKVEKFLIDNYGEISRTTLRYAIERMPENKRKRFLIRKHYK